MNIRYLHTMVRVKDLDKTMDFFRLLGLEETRRIDNDKGRFSVVFMAPPGQPECPVELTHNWDGDEGLPSDSRHFGHLAYSVGNIYEMCQRLQDAGVTINRPPPRRSHGLRAQPRQHLDRAAAGGRCLGAAGALGQHGEYRQLVRAGAAVADPRDGHHDLRRQ